MEDVWPASRITGHFNFIRRMNPGSHYGDPAESERHPATENELGIPRLHCIVFEIPQILTKWTVSDIFILLPRLRLDLCLQVRGGEVFFYCRCSADGDKLFQGFVQFSEREKNRTIFCDIIAEDEGKRRARGVEKSSFAFSSNYKQLQTLFKFWW